MKFGGLVFSARKFGNGYKCMKHCLDKFELKGYKTVLLNAYDYDIKPCSHCNYECYANLIRGTKERCPIEDDVPKLFEKMEDADMLLFAVPCYGGHTPALYRAWSERMPHIPQLNERLKNFDEFRHVFLDKITGIIVIGNLSAQGDMTLHEVLADFCNIEAPEAILLQSREFGRSSLKGDLVESEEVRKKLDRLVELLVKRAERTKDEETR